MPESRTHYQFDGVALAPGGQFLILDYFDPDQGGTRLFFRYTISLKGETWLASGYNLKQGGVGKEITYEEIPKDILQDAAEWLRSNLKNVRERSHPIFKILSDYSELLDPEKRREHLKRAAGIVVADQESFKW